MKILLFLLLAFYAIGCDSSSENKISASGTIETTEVTVSSKVGGQIIRIPVEEGSPVKIGDTLALIDHTDLDIQLDQALANLDAAEAQYKLAKKGAREEDISQADATYGNASDDLKRIENLFNNGSASQKQLDDARTRQILAKESYDKLKNGLRAEEIDAVKARRDQASAQVKAIRKKIEDSYVTAPVNGVVTQKGIEAGEMAAPNSSLVKISLLEKVYLVIYISELELARVKLGQPADVFIDSNPEKPYNGKVTYISSSAEFTPKNIQTKEDRTKLVFGVKIEIENPENDLKAGMPADAVIGLDLKK